MRKLWGPILIFLLSSQAAFSWGETGHRVVGKIAEKHLKLPAKIAVKRLLGNESLAEASTWPDFMRSDKSFDFAKPWHYVTIPYGQEYDSAKANPKGDILQAMQKMENILRGKETDERITKAIALRLLVHFVGDIHQPLHAGNEFDRGGNYCVVTWMKYLSDLDRICRLEANDDGEETSFCTIRNVTNLHKVWDEHIINSTKLSYTEFVDHINHTTRKQVKEWQNSTYLDWANESRDLRVAVYPNMDGEGIQNPQERKYCKNKYEDEISDKFVPKLGYTYRFKHLKTIENRMLQAGIRLAGVLNSIY